MINFKRIQNRKGFTTVELMIAVSLTLLFAASFYGAFATMGSEMWRKKANFDTNVSAKNVMDRMSRDVEEAVSVVASYGGNTTGTNCLILKLPSIDASGVPTSITNQFDYVTYKINPTDSTQLLRTLVVLNGSQREGGSNITNAVVARKVNALSLSYGGTALSSVSSATIPTMKTINVQITAQGTTLGTNQRTQVDSDLMLRNNIS